MSLKMSLQEIVIFKISQNASTLFTCGHFIGSLKECLYNPSDTLFFLKIILSPYFLGTFQGVTKICLCNIYRGTLIKMHI
jgi:hypothetical protein